MSHPFPDDMFDSARMIIIIMRAQLKMKHVYFLTKFCEKPTVYVP